MNQDDGGDAGVDCPAGYFLSSEQRQPAKGTLRATAAAARAAGARALVLRSEINYGRLVRRRKPLASEQIAGVFDKLPALVVLEYVAIGAIHHFPSPTSETMP
jgi:hypothetical protein